MKTPVQLLILTLLLPLAAHAQVNSGSDGHDGAFNPTTSTVINMANHPDGIYHYTSVNIPANVTVTFIPNANNTPVVWLVKSNCVINGHVDVSGQSSGATSGGAAGGPGGWGGGGAGPNPGSGQGPGGGSKNAAGLVPADGSFGTIGGGNLPGPIYGNSFLLPLLGGSGGGASRYSGGGGGGAILIAASGSIQLNGSINASGGGGYAIYGGAGGSGSGGGVRLVAAKLTGSGGIVANGGSSGATGGSGRVRIDTIEYAFGGSIYGVFSQGFQPTIIPASGQGAQLIVTSVGGVPVSASPTGVLATPDAVLSAQQNNPIPIVVQCSNIPLNTQITVSVLRMNGSPITAVGYNNTGTLASSTASVSINIPRGGGLIYATAATSP